MVARRIAIATSRLDTSSISKTTVVAVARTLCNGRVGRGRLAAAVAVARHASNGTFITNTSLVAITGS